MNGGTTKGSRSAGLLLGIDVGSTNVKAAVFTVMGEMLGIGECAQEAERRAVGWEEFHPESVWQAVCAAVRGALAQTDGRRIAAVAITSARGTFALTDQNDRYVTPFISWQDSRGGEMAHVVEETVGADQYREVTGLSPDPSTSLPKLLWLRKERPAIWQEAKHLETLQGSMLRRCGASEPATGTSVASHVGLLNLRTLRWDPRLLEAFDVDASFLPPVVSGGETIARVSRAASDDLGIPVGAELVATGADGVCGSLGAGVVDLGQLYGYLGTASAILTPVETSQLAQPNLALTIAPGSTSAQWQFVALGMAGGSAVDWLCKLTGFSATALDDQADQSPVGARGLRFIPTMAGAFLPVYAPHARGAMLGLSLSHSSCDVLRAALEGVSLEMHLMVTAIREQGVKPYEIRLDGGGAQSRAWCEIQADVHGLPVIRSGDMNLGLRGAACYAASAAGAYTDVLSAARSWSVPGEVFEPRSEHTVRYQEAASQYRQVREILASSKLDDQFFDASKVGEGVSVR